MRYRCDHFRGATGLALRFRVTRSACDPVAPAALPGSARLAARTAPRGVRATRPQRLRPRPGTPRRLSRVSEAPAVAGAALCHRARCGAGASGPPWPCRPQPRSKPSPCAGANSRVAVSIRLPAFKLQRGSGRRNPPWPWPARSPRPAAVSVSARVREPSGAALFRRRLCPAAGLGPTLFPGAPRPPCPPVV